MTGLERNMARLFNHDGKLFLAAFDHPQIYGAMYGLENPYTTIAKVMDTPIDGFILNPGIMAHAESSIAASKKMVLRASEGGTMMGSTYADDHAVIASPMQAISLGADAILVMLVLGGSHDKESMETLSHAVDAFHAYSIPVIAEVLAADYTKNNDPEFIRNGARIGAELGADVIKAFYCTDFKSVVDNCPVPVILAGGPKEADIVEIARSVVRDGAKGFAFGRNIFQSEDPRKAINALEQVLRG